MTGFRETDIGMATVAMPAHRYTVAGKAVGYALVQPPAVVGLKTCGIRNFQPASVSFVSTFSI